MTNNTMNESGRLAFEMAYNKSTMINKNQCSDHTTVSTDPISASERSITSRSTTSSNSNENDKEKEKKEKKIKKRSLLSTRRRKKRAERDLLLGLIAQEMASSWNDNDDNNDNNAKDNVSTARTRATAATSASAVSAADAFYAQMNGEEIQSDCSSTVASGSNGGDTVTTATTNTQRRGRATNYSSPSAARPPITIVEENFNESDNLFCDGTSFAGLVLPGTFEDDNDCDDDDDQEENAALQGRRAELATYTNEGSSRSGKTISTRTSGGTSSSESSGDSILSIEEIRDIVMAQMPDDIRDKIPKEAWERIFNNGNSSSASPTKGRKQGYGVSVDKTRKPPASALNHLLEQEVEEAEQLGFVIDPSASSSNMAKNDTDDDDISVISDITSFTAFAGTSEGSNSAAFSLPCYNETTSKEYHQKQEQRRLCRASSANTDSSTSKKTLGTTKTKISFGSVQVRYYERILEINPSVTSGVAIGIGWRYKKGGVVSVDDWEIQRGDTRTSNELVMPRHVREAILKDIGYTQQDLAAATRIINKAKHQRKATFLNLKSQGIEEAVENATRKVMGLLTFGRKRGIV